MKFTSKGFGKNERFFLDDRQVSKEEFDAAMDAEIALVYKSISHSEGNRPWAKPIASDALAVHPDQIQEVMERNKKHGLEVEYEGEFGRPILKDRDQRKRLMRIEGCHDNNGGYGDG